MNECNSELTQAAARVLGLDLAEGGDQNQRQTLSNCPVRDGSKHPLSSSPIDEVALLEVIYVRVERGTGQKGDELRDVHQYWSKDGRFLAECDMINIPY